MKFSVEISKGVTLVVYKWRKYLAIILKQGTEAYFQI
jgi:hypothetical protein